MPLLAPSLAPPTSPLLPTLSDPRLSSMENNKNSSPALPPLLATTLHQAREATTSRIPVVCLDVDSIADVLAARLATSLLGHVLFLKNQVPFPVMQLARIPNGQSTIRATKMRNELLASFDTLTSHLNTTFTALSTAFALCGSKTKAKNGGEEDKSGYMPDVCIKKNRAYLAIMLGPSISSAKSRVMFAVDGLEAKVWGVRDDEEGLDETDEEDSDSEDIDSDGEEEDESNEDENSVGESEPESDSNSDESPEPPPSRSPSPSPVHSKVPYLTSTRTSLSTHVISRHPTPPRYSYAEEQQALRAGDRLLSRTLAAADSDGRGMACEMAPTQTHILIRAPRRFVHPAWIPRQNVSASLEGMLDEFLEGSGFGRGEGKRKPRRGAKTEGVWIGCRGGVVEDEDERDDGGEEDEEDEMIWWSWDGKIVGFRDW